MCNILMCNSFSSCYCKILEFLSHMFTFDILFILDFFNTSLFNFFILVPFFNSCHFNLLFECAVRRTAYSISLCLCVMNR